jgi:DNA-binding XRE family transcriptional regulator
MTRVRTCVRVMPPHALATMTASRRIPTPSPELLALARRLRQMRRARELSQEALAAIAGVHPKHLSEIERANKDPRATTVIRIADALGVPVAELYED